MYMKSIIIFTGVLICIPAFIYAQTESPAMPSMISAPTINSPSMPSVSSFPVITAQSTQESSATQQNQQTTKKTDKSTTTAAATHVTAADLASFSSLSSSILGSNSSNSTDMITSLLSGSTNTSFGSDVQNTTTNALLEQILARLDALEIQSQPVTQTTSPQRETVQTKGAKIIRCTVNGYNLLETCRTIYSSAKAFDGSFLITGDRKYLSNYKTRSETFYFLLKKVNSSTYDVAVSVIQDYDNEYSFLYQLKNKTSLTAKATGNLLSLKVDELDWKFDMLIDITDLN